MSIGELIALALMGVLSILFLVWHERWIRGRVEWRRPRKRKRRKR